MIFLWPESVQPSTIGSTKLTPFFSTYPVLPGPEITLTEALQPKLFCHFILTHQEQGCAPEPGH